MGKSKTQEVLWCGVAWRVSAAVTLLLAGPASAPASVQQSATTAASLVFDGVTVVDVERGELIPAQRVVIMGNRIEAVGSAAAVEIPEGARVVDARNRYLIPGLWDLHVHPRKRATDLFFPLFVANGVTGFRDAWSTVPLKTQVQWRREILAGARVGPPRQLLSGDAFGQHFRGNADRIAQVVDSLKTDGADFLKVYPFSFEYAAAIRRAGLPFGGHMIRITPFGMSSSEATPIQASDSGMRIFDHVNMTKLIGICFGKDASVEQCRPVAERFRRNGSWWVPTRVGMGSSSIPLDRIGDEPWAHVRRFLAARADEFWAGASLHGNWLRDTSGAGPSRIAGLLPDSLGPMYVPRRAGLPILAGTDEGERKEAPAGFLLHAELAAYVVEGLTPLEALQTATLNPAKLLHGTDSLGTVAPGKLADLVLLDANPLADITNTTTIRAVVANGRYFDRAALDSLLAEVRAKGQGEP